MFVIIVQLLDLSNFFFNAAAGYILGYRSVLVCFGGVIFDHSHPVSYTPSQSDEQRKLGFQYDAEWLAILKCYNNLHTMQQSKVGHYGSKLI